MTSTANDLRDLANQLHKTARAHRAYGMAADIVVNCCNHILTEARCRELQALVASMPVEGRE